MKNAIYYIILFTALQFYLSPGAVAQENGNGGAGGDTEDNWSGLVASKIVNKGNGDGTSWAKAIQIASAQELAYFAKQVNSRNDITYGDGNKSIKHNGNQDGNGFKGYYFALSADIDLSDHYWTPIGYGDNSFKGNFDGLGHCVKGLKVKVGEASGRLLHACAGLFGYTESGTLRNLGVWLAKEGVQSVLSDVGGACAGGIAGSAKNIFNCYVVGEGVVEAAGKSDKIGTDCNSYAGGIVGSLGGSLSDCYATVGVKAGRDGGGSYKNYAGGIVGYASDNLSHTYATGAVEAVNGSENYAGGICGYLLNGSISNNLALNSEIKGDEGKSCRIVGGKNGEKTLIANYASRKIQVNNGVVSPTSDTAGKDGAHTWLDTFASDLIGDPAIGEWDNAWVWTDGNLPQLKIVEGDIGNPTYKDNWPGKPAQPVLVASDYLIVDRIANAGDGDGKSWEKPILIANRAELAYLAQQVNAGGNLKVGNGTTINHDGFSGLYFALAGDIDLSGYYWTPIGNEYNSFNGNFDGRGHCVKGLKVKIVADGNGSSYSVYAGLFGNTSNGTLQNIGVRLAEEGIWVEATNAEVSVGGIAGYAYYIRNCYVEGPETGPGRIVTKVTGSFGDLRCGGIVGYNTSPFSFVTHCYTTVDVKAEGVINKEGSNIICCAGGIGGDFVGALSYTYATGTVEATGGNNGNYAGGINGRGANFSHNLALNKAVTGDPDMSGRIVGYFDQNISLSSNYASKKIQVNNGAVSPTSNAAGKDGADTWLETFATDLKGDPATGGWDNAWAWTGAYLPQLKIVEGDIDNLTYKDWPGQPAQPTLMASDYLTGFPRLHIVQPAEGGTLTVCTSADPNTPLNDKVSVRPGTSLMLSYTAGANYHFESFLSGASEGGMTDYNTTGNTITMPESDLWLGVRFSYQPPTPPPPPPAPVYYTVSLPAVEGASTDPVAGDYEVESWDTFRFYLTLEAAYDQSLPVVTTSRGETIRPRTSDGAYLVKYVCSDVSIRIDGVVSNPDPVANEPISVAPAAPQIWTERSMLCILIADDAAGDDAAATGGAGHAASPATASQPTVRILTFDGRLMHTFRAAPGLTRRQLPTGMYVIQVDNVVRKVAVR